MGLFNKKKEGRLMDVIRCDEQEYLVKKWSPSGDANSSNKENAIRWGSSLRVKDGEAAVFVYKQSSGQMQDIIIGPHDDTIKTANFPILSSIVGLAFGGGSPFQAEVYFINLQASNQVRFGVQYFDVFDPRFLDFAVPMAARGSITFAIEDINKFIKTNRLINFELEHFQKQIKDAVIKYTKGFISNVPSDCGMPVLQIERKILEISDMIQGRLKADFELDFGVTLKRFDLSAIEVDKESEGYTSLMKVTKDQQTATIQAQTLVGIKNMADTQSINAENMQETLRTQREEMQRTQKLQTESNFMGAHALNQQTEILKTGATSLGTMGGSIGGGSGDGMNPAGMMAGMMMGGAMGNQMAGMINTMGQTMNSAMNNSMNTPPPMPQVEFMVSVNGQQSGPYNMQQLQQLAQNRQLTKETYVWKNGMAGWEFAGNVPELSALFNSNTPPPPMPMP